MDGFPSLLLEISREIEHSELNTMKHCCSEYNIGAKRLEEITEARELFRDLRKLDLLGPQNLGILLKLLDKAGRIDLKNKVLNAQGLTRVSSQLSVPDGPSATCVPALKDTHLNDISEDLGREWKSLGRKLGISSSIIDNIDLEHRRVKEKGFQMLSRWKKLNAENATRQVLADTLRAIGRTDVAEELERICQEDDTSIHTQDEEKTSEATNEQSQTDSAGLDTMQRDLAPKLPMQESSGS